MRHIMVAHDLSVQAGLALQRAAQLAGQHGARLTLLHVQEPSPKPAEQQAVQEAALASLQLQADQQEVAAEIVIARGQPAQTLVAQLRAREVDLLVMGDHHQSSRVSFSGTTLEQVLQKSSAAVLLVVTDDQEPYARALVPMDFSACGGRALQMTRRLLPVEADIQAVHVQEQALVHGCATDEHEWQAGLFAQLIADEQATMPEQGAAISEQVLHGELHACLANVISDYQPQLLALGKHGRGEMADALLGSLARHFLENPPCDVLLVK